MNKYFLLLLFFSSCGLSKNYKSYFKQLHKYKDNAIMPFEMAGNRMQIKVNVNGNDEEFMFDTGFELSAIVDSNLYSKLTNTNILKTIKTKSVTGVKQTNELFALDSLKTNIVDLYNKQIMFSPIEYNLRNKKCANVKGFNGVFGIDLLEEYTKGFIMLDFDKNEIKTISNDDRSIDSYILVSNKISRFPHKKIMIPLKINNKEIYFHFDTGNSADLYIQDSLPDIVTKINTDSYIAGSNGVNKISSKTYTNTDVIFCNLHFKNLCITNTNSIKNNMGMGFIKYFNWIIDFKNSKIYAKRNNIVFKETNYNYLKSPKVAILQNQLLLVSKPTGLFTKYNLGDTIISVNNVSLTPENICTYADSLNNATNWDLLKVQVINSN